MNVNALQPTPTLTIVASAKPAGTDGPTLVITMPFDPKMTPKGAIEAALKETQTRVVRQLMAQYSRDTALLIIHRMQQLIFNLNYNTHKKGIALLVSPETQYVLYLDQAVPTQILLNHPFRIRDLTTLPENPARYLVLLLSGRLSKMYVSKGEGLQLIKQNVCPPMEPCTKEDPDSNRPCTGLCVRKEALLDTFLHHMDEGLSVLLDAYDLPVFVIAHDKIAKRFEDISRNDRHIAAYIHQNHIQSDQKDLLAALQPCLDNWHEVRQQMALKNITIARNMGKLSTGIQAVAKAAHNRNNRLLIVEKDFTDSSIYPKEKSPFFIKDAVDGIIEKVLEHGGQVEWVDKGRLDNEDHIALVRYY